MLTAGLKRRRIMRNWIIAIALGLALFALGARTAVALDLVETSTKTKGATTITWDSSFQDLNYSLGDTITMTVNWAVDQGAATYDSFALKRFTPKSQKDPADGQIINVSQSDNAVTIQFKFTDLHLDAVRNVEVGNAHFKLYLWIDQDGDGATETLAGYGVNVHVEDPQ